MSSSWEKFSSYYNQSNSAVQRVIDGPLVPEFIDRVLGTNTLTTKHRNELIALLLDVILRIMNTNELRETLENTPVYAPLLEPKVFEEIELFCKKIRNMRSSKVSATGQIIENETETVPEKKTTKIGYGNSLEQIKPMNEPGVNPAPHGYGVPSYTSDGPDDPTHSSTQDDVLTRKNTESPSPTRHPLE